jgi:hypothetical protein
VYFAVYEGQHDMGFDCVGAFQCAHARYDVEPPDPDDECAFLHHGSCTHAPARKAALEQIRDQIEAVLKEYATEDPGGA